MVERWGDSFSPTTLKLLKEEGRKLVGDPPTRRQIARRRRA